MSNFYEFQNAAIGRRHKAGLPLRRKPKSREDPLFTAAVTAAAPKPARKPTRMPVGTAYSGLWLVDCGGYKAFVGYIHSRNGREVTLLHSRLLYGSAPFLIDGTFDSTRLARMLMDTPVVPLLIMLDVVALIPLAPGVTLPEPE